VVLDGPALARIPIPYVHARPLSTDDPLLTGPGGNRVRGTGRFLLVVPALVVAACTATKKPEDDIWVALDAYSVRELPERSLLPMGRLRPDGGWDLPWPRSFAVSLGSREQVSSVRVDDDGFLHPPEEHLHSPDRPGVSWLLPYEVYDSGRLRSVAPLNWYRYAAGELVQGRPARADRLLHSDLFGCGLWVLGGREEVRGAVSAGLALSRPATRGLTQDDLPDLDEMLTAAGFPHQPSDADGGYRFEGDYRNPPGRYPRRTVAGLARVREDLDVALVRYEEAGPRFGGHVTTWALVELRAGRANVVSELSGNRSLCVRRPAENRTEALWMALVSQEGSRLDPIGRRHPDGSWDLPWPDFVTAAAIDSSGNLRRWQNASAEPQRSGDGWPLPFRVVGGDRVRIDVPLQWYRYNRLTVVQGTVTHVMLAERGCEAGWSLAMDPGSNMTNPGGSALGVAFSLPAAVRLNEQDVPGLDSIQAALGLLDRPPRDRGGYRMGGNWYPNREIIGLYRLGDDAIIGVVGEYHYEGQGTVVFEISGDSARIVSDASGGGC